MSLQQVEQSASGGQHDHTLCASRKTETAILHAKLDTVPPTIVNSRGIHLITEDGREIVDASTGAAVACIGHNNARVNAAIMSQLNSFAYIYSPFFTSKISEKLAKALSDSTQNQMAKAFIVSSGTEAIEAALKMARQYFLELPEPQTERTHFIARRQSYHGNTLGSLSVGGHFGRRAPYKPLLMGNVSHVSPCYAYRGKKPGESDEDFVARLAQELEDEFQAVGPNTVCAFVAETVSGTTLGCVPPVPGYFKAMREVCNRHGALLVMDEVMSGMGRCGTLHAWEQEGVVPDLQTVAKGLGGGYAPIGALLVNKRVIDALEKGSGAFVHSQTYQGHPVACAAAYEVQQIMQEENLLKNVRELGPYMGKLLQDKLGDHPHVGDIRGRGFFWGLEFVKDKATKEPFPVEQRVAPTVFKTGLADHSISFIPGSGVADGKNGDIIQIAPPYNASRADIEMIAERTAQVVRQVLG
ncbi:putative aminobutyrate aminotransferase [Aspergillus taichungensis]|uniref:Putative aminobutyrate aminotransferase n=1 Tax=Aspergillus taichungensis TaxID=482145 RepID=A0A2J5HIG9_9EURO|nr:putative aminobutyrate aminotransferase [Aspergillus taichungensis]